MSANESTPAVSLREARQREARARDTSDSVANRMKVIVARRATDEALVRAVMEYVKCWEVMLENGGVVSYNRNGDTLDPAGVLDAVEAGGGGTMTTLPEAVEQAIHAADETNTRIAEAANGSDLTDLYTEWREALTALRAAILAYGAARERQGIERAALVADNFDGPADASDVGNAIRALPVDGATP